MTMTEYLPDRGEIWWVQFEPAIGSEARKLRPAVVVSVHDFASQPVRVVVPLTSWRDRFARHRNKVYVATDDGNNLGEDSAADFLRVRSLAIERFGDRIGSLREDALRLIVEGVALVVGYEPR